MAVNKPPLTPPNPMSPNLQGVLWALLSTAIFALVAALAKIASGEYHVLQILFIRQVVVFLAALPSIAGNFPQSLRTQYPKLHLIRLVGAFLALSCSIWAVSVLPLTTAITLTFAQVFFVTLLAMWVLNEPVGRHRITAVVCGFAGVLFATRPGVSGFFDVYALVPILGAFGAAMAVTSIRRLSQTESTATLLAYQAIFVGALAGIPMIWLWETPDTQGWVLMLGMGALSSVGQWIGVKALRLGEASVVTNIQYMKLIYAAILGYILFLEIPDSYTLIGAAIIIGSSVYMMHRERRLKIGADKSAFAGPRA